MVEVDGAALGDAVLSRAVVVWIGWGITNAPRRDDSRVVEYLGHELAAYLLPLARDLEADFYASDASRRASDLQEMGDRASERFRALHPEVGEAAVRALAWAYTFDHK